MASPYGPQPLQRAPRSTGWESALASFQDAYTRSGAAEDERRRSEEEYERGEPDRVRARELHELNLWRGGIRRGRAPQEEEEEDPFSGQIGLGPEQGRKMFEEPDPLSGQLGIQRSAGMPRRPKIIAPPGAFVPGRGFSREPVTEEDLAGGQEPGGQPGMGIGLTGRDAARVPPPRSPTAQPRTGPRPEQINEKMYYDPALSPEGRARAERGEQAGELSSGLGSLIGLPPDQVAGLRRYVAAGGDPSDYLIYKRAIDTDRVNTPAPPRVRSESGEILERQPDGSWAPARTAEGRPVRGQEPMQLILGESGQYERVPTRGPTGPVSTAGGPLKRPPTEGQLTREQKIQENRSLMADLEATIDLVEQNPTAFGLQNAITWIPKVGSPALAYLDPKGVKARAAVQDAVGKLMHDRLGSAQSAGELMRAEGWAAAVTDPHFAIVTKLNRLIERIEQETQALSRVREE